MDSQYLDLLVHPVNKLALKFDGVNNQLVEESTGDCFSIKEGVPVLLSKIAPKNISKTEIHNSEGTQFEYRAHYQNDAELFDYTAETKDPLEKAEIQRLHQNILAEVPKNASWILDVGTGGAWLAKNLVPLGKNVISMDISEKNPIRAIKNLPSSHHFALVADVFELPIKDNAMDVIVASEIIEHLSQPGVFIAALYKALKPGGKIIITTPYNETIQYSQCIHCNHLTPQNAHLHSFTEYSILKFLPENIKSYQTKIINNKILAKLRLQLILKGLPLPLWNIVDKISNKIIKKSFRLMLIIKK